MLDGSYSASDTPVTVTAGPDLERITKAEAWAAGLNDRNTFTVACGDTWLILARERPPASEGAWQKVYDHVETWGEALAIYRALQGSPHIKSVRALPSDKLRNLSKITLAAARRAMRAEGWILDTGDEWIMTREVADGQ